MVSLLLLFHSICLPHSNVPFKDLMTLLKTFSSLLYPQHLELAC